MDLQLKSVQGNVEPYPVYYIGQTAGLGPRYYLLINLGEDHNFSP